MLDILISAGQLYPSNYFLNWIIDIFILCCYLAVNLICCLAGKYKYFELKYMNILQGLFAMNKSEFKFCRDNKLWRITLKNYQTGDREGSIFPNPPPSSPPKSLCLFRRVYDILSDPLYTWLQTPPPPPSPPPPGSRAGGTLIGWTVRLTWTRPRQYPLVIPFQLDVLRWTGVLRCAGAPVPTAGVVGRSSDSQLSTTTPSKYAYNIWH